MLMRAVVIFCGLTLASGVIARADRTDQPAPVRVPFDKFPMQIAGWQGVEQPPFDDKVRAILGADDYLNRSFYTPDGSEVGLYVGYWQSQRQGDTIHSPLNCLPGSGWEPLSKTELVVPVPGKTSSIRVNRFVVQNGLDRQIILYWYQSHGRVVASEYWSKYFLVADALRTGRTDAAIVRITAPIPGSGVDDEIRAEHIAARFVQALLPALSNYLPD